MSNFFVLPGFENILQTPLSFWGSGFFGYQSRF